MIKCITLAWCRGKFASDTRLSWRFESLADGNCLHHISQGFVTRGNFSGGSLQRTAGPFECRIPQSCSPTLTLLRERSHRTGSFCTICCHLPAQLTTAGQKRILINNTDATFLKSQDLIHGWCKWTLITGWTEAELQLQVKKNNNKKPDQFKGKNQIKLSRYILVIFKRDIFNHRQVITFDFCLGRSLTRMTKRIVWPAEEINCLSVDEINDGGGHSKITFQITTLTSSV